MKIMGGRGSYALRRLSGFSGIRAEQIAAGRVTTSTTSGARASFSSNDITDEQAKAALGASFTREDVRSILGADAAGASVVFTVEGNSIQAQINNSTSGYSAKLTLSRSGGVVTFTGNSLFAADRSNNAAAGAGIRSFRRGLADGVERGLVDRLVVPNAIGSAGNQRAQGSNLWARMGASAPLREVLGSNFASRLPASLSGSKEIADLMLSREGRAWWSANRTSFRGEINFRDKSSTAYKVAKRFLGKRS
jgi:hypothetical protein